MGTHTHTHAHTHTSRTNTILRKVPGLIIYTIIIALLLTNSRYIAELYVRMYVRMYNGYGNYTKWL